MFCASRFHRQAINSSFSSLPGTTSEDWESKHVGSALCWLLQCQRFVALKAACYHSMQQLHHQISPWNLNQIWWFHPHLLLTSAALKRQKVTVFTESSKDYTLLFSITLVWSEKWAPTLSQEWGKLVLPPFIPTFFLSALSESQFLRIDHPHFLSHIIPQICM